MYNINKWKLALIIGMFVFSALYLLPTIPGVYGKLYGYFDIWMQDRISPPDVQSAKDGEFIRFVIPRGEGNLPKGVSVQEASKSIQDTIERRLSSLGIRDSVVTTDLYVKFNDAKSKADLEEIIGKIQPLVHRQATLPDDEYQTNIKFTITNDDLPEGGSMQETLRNIKEKMKEQLAALEISSDEFSFDDIPGSEFSFDNSAAVDLYIRFSQMKSKADLERIVEKIQPLIHRQPDLSGDEYQGSIKLTITKDDFPEEGGMQEALREIKDKLKEQLETLEIGSDEFSFSDVPKSELHMKFSQQRSRAELEKLIEDLRLYGSIPLGLRPIFPDNPLKQGLDLKGGLHIVLELDVKKAMDIYLDNQAKEAILGTLKREKIFCRSVEKTLEKRGDNTLILRPYAPDGSAAGNARYMVDMKKQLIAQGFNQEDIDDTSDKGPELTVRINVEQDIGGLVDSLLGGSNPLIVTITIPQRLQGADRTDYLETAEEVLDDRLELFDKPRRLSVADDVAVFSVQLSEESAQELAEDNIGTVMETLENRINKFGLAESTIRRVRGKPRILIQIPEEQNPARTLAAIKSPGILEFMMVIENPTTGAPWYGGPGITEPSPEELPLGTVVRQHVEGGWYVLDSEAFLYGADLRGNSARVRQGEFGTLEIVMYLTSEGRSKFSETTGQHVGEQTAILLDEVIQSAPRITEKIDSPSARITGSFTEEEADYLAKILKAGSFPAPMKSAEERIVGPTLGEAAINRGKLAFVIGITFVIVFMLVYYKWSGCIAVIALLFNFQIILGVLAGFGATLTLPGMAGLILTIGMSVDANVLIFERIREELRSGKTVRSSIDSGYQKAFWTILDANVTTFLTALVLYEFGTGPIKGFAVTLSIGIMASMFTALIVTREIYSWVYRKRTIAKLSI